jgi:hypothetical protein
MPIIILLIVLAIVFGAVGVIIEGLLWLLLIGLILLVVGAVLGFRGASSRGRSSGGRP